MVGSKRSAKTYWLMSLASLACVLVLVALSCFAVRGQALADDKYPLTLAPQSESTAQAGSWESESNNSRSYANTISANTRWYGNVSDEYDSDYYKIHLAKASRVAINFQHPLRNTTQYQWTLNLMDADGTFILTRNITGKATNVTLTPVGIPAGDYYLQVKPYSTSYWSGVTYNFMVGTTATTVWETEKNDYTDTATNISVNTRYYGTIRKSSDYDYYKLHLSSASKVVLNFQHPNRNTSIEQWTVYIRDSGNHTIMKRSIAGNATNVSFPAVGLAAGDYFVEVQPYSSTYWSGATYNFMVGTTKTTVWESELNDTRTEADVISLSGSHYGTINSSTDWDYYRFHLSSYTDLGLTFNHPYRDTNVNLWTVRLYDSNGNYITETSSNGYETSKSMYASLAAGDYYVLVKYYSSTYWSSGTYNFSLW